MPSGPIARRLVAERCLAGVDLNPVAVQLARLSLWLTTLASGKPLSFLDHRLRRGNSLVGAAPADLVRVRTRPGRRESAALPLFDDVRSRALAAQGRRPLADLAFRRDDTVDDVRAKEAAWQRIAGSRSPLAPLAAGLRRSGARAGSWTATLRRRRKCGRCSTRVLQRRRDAGRRVDVTSAARGGRVRRATSRSSTGRSSSPTSFYEHDGRPRTRAGFDAVIGNPPWEMLRERRTGDRRATSCASSASPACTRRAIAGISISISRSSNARCS